MPSHGKPLILVVTSTLPRWPDDTEPAFVLDLCRTLSSRYDILVLAPHCRGAARSERRDGIEIRRFRYFFQRGEVLAYEGGILPKLRRRPWLWLLVPFFFAAQTLAIARALRREPFALLHAHWLIPQGVCARLARRVAGARVPLIVTAHGADVLGLRGRLAATLQRWVARGCRCVGAVSAALGEELARRGVAREVIRLLPMGVVIPARVPGRAERDPHLVAFAGRIVEKKGVGVLLDAFARLAHEEPGARLVIAGGGPELPERKAQVEAAGLGARVEFLGAVPHAHVQALFARAAVAVMPSITASDGDAEGLGLVMLEAMAGGCPVVVSDLPVVRDVIRPGENALVFPERDGAALAAALGRMLSDAALAEQLAAQARRDVADRYSWSAVAGRHAAVYAEAMRA